MTNDKHTGGRWFVYLAGHRREVRSDAGGLPGGIGLHIATVIRDEKGPDEMDADAHLMAASPDMLEALQDLAHPERRTDCNERKCGSCSTCRARAAIAKAGGR